MTPNENAPACWCCWPSFSPATVRDRQGVPCCNACMANPDRKPNVPRFMLGWLDCQHEPARALMTGHPDMLEDAPPIRLCASHSAAYGHEGAVVLVGGTRMLP